MASSRRQKTGTHRLREGNPTRKIPGPPGWGLSGRPVTYTGTFKNASDCTEITATTTQRNMEYSLGTWNVRTLSAKEIMKVRSWRRMATDRREWGKNWRRPGPNKGCSAIGERESGLTHRTLRKKTRKETRLKFYKTNPVPVLLYRYETWVPTNKIVNQIRILEM